MTMTRKEPATLDDRPSLPVQGAFVVRLRADTDVTTDRLTGRVEHVVTARTATFGDVEELLAFMGAALGRSRED